MENNLHDNKLDDYVRRSFEGYEEDPVPDMWRRIEGGLQPEAEPAPPLRVVFLRLHRWHLAAAAVILLLLSTLVCEHFYYQEKLRALSAKPTETQVFSTENPSEGSLASDGSTAFTPSGQTPFTANRPAPVGSTEYSQESMAQPATEPRQNAEAVSPKTKSAGTTSSRPGTAPGSGLQSAALTGSQHLHASGQRPTAGASQSRPGTAAEPERNVEVVSTQTDGIEAILARLGTVHSTALDSTKMIASQPASLQMLALPPIFPRNVLLEIPQTLPAAFKPLPTRVLREPSGWYVGAQVTLLSTLAKSRAPITRPGRLVWVSQQEGAETSALWWLRVGKKLSARFALESGIGYQKTAQTATHSPRFRFGDGTAAGTRRTFQYDLNTYGGTAAVSLRMEPTNPSLPAPADGEQVLLNITTTERAELLHVPLLAVYQLGMGRWRGQLKAGAVGHFFLKNELDIAARVSQNTRLRPLEGRGGYSVSLSQPEKFFLGYWLSTGTEFKLSRHLSLVAEPSLAGDFARKDASGQRLPERFSWGVTVGGEYGF